MEMIQNKRNKKVSVLICMNVRGKKTHRYLVTEVVCGAHHLTKDLSYGILKMPGVLIENSSNFCFECILISGGAVVGDAYPLQTVVTLLIGMVAFSFDEADHFIGVGFVFEGPDYYDTLPCTFGFCTDFRQC